MMYTDELLCIPLRFIGPSIQNEKIRGHGPFVLGPRLPTNMTRTLA